MSQIIFLNTAISGRVQTGLKQFASVKGQKTTKARNNLYIHVLFQARYFYWSHRYWKRKHLDPTRWHKNRQLVHKHIRFK